MQKKKSKSKAVATKASLPPKPQRGRPALEFRKRSFHILLDPRYIEHFRERADAIGVRSQDLARMALNSVIPDPFNPATITDLARLLNQMRPNATSDKKK